MLAPGSLGEEEGSSSGRRALDGLAVLAIGLGCFLGVVVFLPAEGRIGGPVHDGVGRLLGHFSFVLPLGLVGLGLLVLAPGLVPMSRLVGVAVVMLAGLATGGLLGLETGLVGAWLGGVLVDGLGGTATGAVLVGLLVVGVLLAFDVSLAQVAAAAVAAYRWLRPRVGTPRVFVARRVAED